MRSDGSKSDWLDIARYRVILFCALNLVSAPASANDTSAALGVGGLVFQVSQKVEMLSEDLFVSREQIVVDYRFRNVGASDTTSLVAFPLPEIKYEPGRSIGIDDAIGSSDFLNFSTFVDNVPVKMDVERKAMLHGRDEAATLQRYSVPLDPYAAYDFLEKADQALVSQLKRLSLVDVDGSPTWGLKATYFWEQTFPRGRELRIEHRYRPIAGGSVVALRNSPADGHDFYARFCVDNGLLREAAAVAKGRSVSDSFSENYIEYILTTGANWLGPIKKFRLVVDKEREDNLVSFCGEGVRKIGPTQFELTASNFTPRSDLAILILLPTKIDTVPGTGNEPPSEEKEVDLTKLSCDELWYRRNSVFKNNGYCFKSPEAIARFGNAGCRFDNSDQVPLGDADRGLVNAIRIVEQVKRCSR